MICKKKRLRILVHNVLSTLLYLISDEKNFVVVTGSDSSHFKSLCQMLFSLSIHCRDQTKIIVYDLGFNYSERSFLLNNFKKIDLRTFDYSLYPAYFNIKINAGEYAWKPVIFREVLMENKGIVCWMDAGNIVTEPLKKLRKITKFCGLYSPYSFGTIKDWTHPGTLEYLDAANDILDKRNLTAGFVSAYYNNLSVVSLVNKWSNCALVKRCIAPVGSGKHNHRQDQAVLSVLAHKEGIPKSYLKYLQVGVVTHQDID